MTSPQSIPARSELAVSDTWDLSGLFADDAAWEKALADYSLMIDRIAAYRGTLGESAARLRSWLDFCAERGILEERLGNYASLRQSEDEGATAARSMMGRFVMAASRAAAEGSWATPELQAIEDARLEGFLAAGLLDDFRIFLAKLRRFKPHILSEPEERVLAVVSEAEGTAHEAFSVLTNVDLDFGEIETDRGRERVSQATFSRFMEHPDRAIRERAYSAFYGQFNLHKTTLAALYSGSVKQDVVQARVRSFPSARAAALFPDKVDEAVYDNLVSTVTANLAPLHRYYDLRRRLLGLESLRHYDVYAPLVPKANETIPWDKAVRLIADALAPLGGEYVDTLRSGLLGRWADRYENRGKRSGAFSSGGYTGEPYILMNYKDDVIRDVFTLAHEGGHSMHSWYSARANHFMHYGYTIFEAEVASTFNEELLFRHLMGVTESRETKAYLVNKRLDDILATLFRQTMFAEFEAATHRLYESGEALTLELLRSEYRALLGKYFGPGMDLAEESDLEGLRIPHFYRAFYVYKYATGISASLALAERVLAGSAAEREDYFAFLRSGGSRYPIESLRVAGVDMATPAPIEAACQRFGRLVDEFEALLD